MRYPEPYRGAVELQRLLLKDARDTKTTPSARSQLARAYKELEDLKLRMRMKAPPKPIDTTLLPKPQRRAKPSGTFADPDAPAVEPRNISTPPTEPIAPAEPPELEPGPKPKPLYYYNGKSRYYEANPPPKTDEAA